MSGDRLTKLLDYKTLRLLMGIIALVLPLTVSLASSTRLYSVSGAYYTEARYILLVMLVLVGLLLFAYSGHSARESMWSKVAAVASLLLVFFPTDCTNCRTTISGQIHFISGAILFLILAYFCLVPFQKNTRGMKGKRARRSLIYRICGWTMLACIVGLFFANILLSTSEINEWRLTYYGETIALNAFGIAWIVSGKTSRLIAEEDELFTPFNK